MENLDLILKIYFQKVSPGDILHGRISCDAFPKADYDALTRNEIRHLSESEAAELYHYLEEKEEPHSGENGLNVFRLLKERAGKILFIRNSQPVCRYQKLFRWRSYARWFGEDLPICAYLAWRSEHLGQMWNDFEWNSVIGHDNFQINRIMQRGISDNHFHLFGSAPSFQLIWLKLMNHVTDSQYKRALHEMDEKRRAVRSHYKAQYQEDSLVTMHFQAAVIRVVLFWYLNNPVELSEEDPKKKEDRWLLEEIAVIDEILKEDPKKKEDGWLLNEIAVIDEILKVEDYRYNFEQQIQSCIDALRLQTFVSEQKEIVDYAVYGIGKGGVIHDFEGERKLLYQMLYGYVDGRPILQKLQNWFYAYLVIKGRFYEELVQVNETVGFQNFAEYNNRKGSFLFSEFDQEKMVQHAVLESLESGCVRSLEMRIVPRKTVKENRRMIQKYDSCLRDWLTNDQINRMYYVLHFPKKQDVLPYQKSGIISEYRHFAYRDGLDHMAENLISFREKASEEAARVRAIDACSQEIGCRPEVFAPSFRRLTSHVVPLPNYYKVCQWKITYHVGEDFLDLVDGLRAIDEAVFFLQMKNGDRLGHATALGLDVRKWYEYKKKSISLPLQDYLDNVVWMYHKLIEFDITSCETLKGFLLGEYESCFNRLYNDFIDTESVEMLNQRLFDEGKKGVAGFFSFDINTYYQAWRLRGDDPSLYSGGYYDNQYEYFYPYRKNNSPELDDAVRLRPEIGLLYFFYHYSADVRYRGRETKVTTVPDYYIEGVKEIQSAMQDKIAELGIAVEANPSSNYLISTMERYEDHPIINLFNMGLTVNHKEIQKCPQIHISIKTDDKGVFHTSLENEFALMVYALEDMKTGKGKKRYPRQMVYDWLDHVRQNGNQQSFLEWPDAEEYE